MKRLWQWWRSPERRLWKEARRSVDRLFAERPDLLARTSLRPQHRGRTQILEVRGDPLTVIFGILRHPRPYAFSRQFHEVVELWSYEPEAGRIERLKGHNLSRARGRDGDPPGAGV